MQFATKQWYYVCRVNIVIAGLTMSLWTNSQLAYNEYLKLYFKVKYTLVVIYQKSLNKSNIFSRDVSKKIVVQQKNYYHWDNKSSDWGSS